MKPQRKYEHVAGTKVSAVFAKDAQAGFDLRYRLEISLGIPLERKETACVIMQNPSYANEIDADKSVQFMENVVFGGLFPEFFHVRKLIVVNQFARILTNGFAGYSEEIGTENNLAIQSAFDESHVIIVGWGKTNRFEERKKFALDLLRDMKGKQLFQTRMHPSRGRYENFIQPLNL